MLTRRATSRFFLSLSFAAGCAATATAAPQVKTIDYPGALLTIAADINSRGDIVGHFQSGLDIHGYLLADGVFTPIDYPAASSTDPVGINDRGDIVGYYRVGSKLHGFLRSKHGVLTTIEIAGADPTIAKGINNQGDIVGSTVVNGVTKGFLLPKGDVHAPVFYDTPLFGINNRGDVVGLLMNSPVTSSGILISKGDRSLIDYPGQSVTQLIRINSRGDILGISSVAFLLSQGVFTTLAIPGAKSTIAGGINESGTIVGLYQDSNNNFHGFVMN